MSKPPSSSGPPVYALLAEEPNLAVDAALLEALPDLAAELQTAAVDTLIGRSRDRGLAGLVGNFETYNGPLQKLIVDRIEWLYAGARLAIGDQRIEFRLGAIELIRRSGHHKLVYLLDDALRSAAADRQTRERAAVVLCELTTEHLARRDRGVATDADARSLAQDGEYLARALGRAIDCWELHFRSEVLMAAVWLGDRLERALLQKADSTRSRFASALIETAYGAYDPRDGRLAGFALRALPSPALRNEMTKRLTSCRNPDFVQGLIDESWLLADPCIERAFKRVRRLAWLEDGATVMLDLSPRRAEGMLRLIGASGLTPAAKLAAYRRLLSSDEPALQEAAFWKLVQINTDGAAGVLHALAGRPDGRLSALAARELRRRGYRTADPPSLEDGTDQFGLPAHARTFDRFWQTFDPLDEEAGREAAAALTGQGDQLLAPLAVKLGSSEPRDRSKALGIARMLDLGEPLAEHVYRLANDADSVVRSTTAALLGELGGATGLRILRRLLDDPDPRVQSNAIEAIDRRGEPHRAEQFAPKLEARHHRVRATAVAALLKLRVDRAGEVLLDMLEDPSGTHRIAALWVVERLHLGSLLDRLALLAEQDPDSQVRRRARRVYRSIATRSMPLESAEALEDELV